MAFKAKLKDLTLKIGSGSTPRGGKEAYFDDGEISLIRSQNIYNHYFQPNGLAYISEEQAYKLRNVVIEENDILINITGDSIARNMIVEPKYLPARVNQHVSIIRSDTSKLDPYYLSALLTSEKMQEYLLSIGQTGGTRAALTKKMLEELEIPLFEIEVQQAIGNQLKLINEKINTNNKVIDNLQQLAQTLFKRWFVDFEFPNDNNELYKSSGGEMVESELGMIPNDWNIKRLDEISKSPIICGKTPRTKVKENYGTEMPFITIPDMHNNIYILKTARYLSVLGVKTQPTKTVPAKSISVSCIASPGLVVLTSEASHTNQQINTFIPHEIDTFFMFLYLQRLSPLIIELGSGGSTTLNLNKSQFEKITVIYPIEIYRERFHNLVESLFKQILNIQKEIEVLESLRDTLLPKLLSGEIEIPDETEVTEDVPI